MSYGPQFSPWLLSQGTMFNCEAPEMFCRLINWIFIGAVPLNSTRHHVNWNNEGLERIPTSVYPYPLSEDIYLWYCPLTYCQVNVEFHFFSFILVVLPSPVFRWYFWNGHVWISKLIPLEIQSHLCHYIQFPCKKCCRQWFHDVVTKRGSHGVTNILFNLSNWLRYYIRLIC